VISVILYPFKIEISQSPYVEVGADGPLLEFSFITLFLWEMEVQPFLTAHVVWLYSLLPAMRGANVALLKHALREMQRYFRPNQFESHMNRFSTILARSSTLTRAEKEEVATEMRKHYKYDFFLDHNPDVIRKTEQAHQEGEIGGEIRGLRKAALSVISLRFASLEVIARPLLDKVNQEEQLNKLLTQFVLAREEAEVRKILEELRNPSGTAQIDQVHLA
jgi:hypothetical protein